MYDIGLIIKIFLFAIGFVSIYVLHKILFNSSYFGFSEVVYGYKGSISLKAISLKLIIPLTYTGIVYYFTHSFIITFGSIFWGSILIITPPCLNPICQDERLYNFKTLLYFVYLFFVIMNCLVSVYSIKLYICLSELLKGYFAQFENIQQIFNHCMDIIIFPMLISIMIACHKPIINLFNKEIDNPYYNYDETDETELL